MGQRSIVERNIGKEYAVTKKDFKDFNKLI